MIQIIPQIASHLLLDRDYSIKHFRYILCVISFVVIFVVNTDRHTYKCTKKGQWKARWCGDHIMKCAWCFSSWSWHHLVLMMYRRGQHFAVDSILPIPIVLHLKLTSAMILKELYSIEKCAVCLDTFLRF